MSRRVGQRCNNLLSNFQRNFSLLGIAYRNADLEFAYIGSS